ncbi:amidohydrolase [Elizabethkingia anophelis]|uniref:Omega-amidase YafV n=1 Tax=Elizabethkingia anophelis TaxID=1117645 RepID=A0A494J9C5_9FLAO|nr:amidohydrolase [Elizabethkingia anophelis]AQW97714.1 amidohydrolase [Elizabethkingia anophelis]AQX49929.1 amidohydrolase [Elizabethkingia anophelis]ASV77493.1 amidohydrolase [Elizabethkingia anophelis]EHM7979983.1 amidohydrolase [Elizabethkingia anophelis]EHM8031124.1 amidohydrolase [Elizabethkingia anophelis]
MKNLKILGLQHDIQWKNKDKNFEIIEDLLPKEEKPDIFLLPEMFATGFCMDAEEIADQNNEVLIKMKSLAVDNNIAVGGSVAVKEGGKFYNRFYFIEKNGTLHHYDKRHLFSYAKEDQFYTPGKEKVVVEYLGWKICLQVCYDLRFPVFVRNTENYDLILNVASWPSTRIDAWDTLLKARAIENQCYVFGLNRVGNDGNKLQYNGSSHCFFADGSEIALLKDNLIYAELDKDLLIDFRTKFPFLADQDNFSISI